MTVETLRLRGRSAAPGLAAGRIANFANGAARTVHHGSPDLERAALEHALANAASDLRALASAQAREAAEILEFQLSLLEDEDLSAPAFADIGAGTPAGEAWTRALDSQIADYETVDDEYFRARASDFIDVRDRVSRALSAESNATPSLPEGAILVADDLQPSRFLEIDWTRGAGIALKAGSATSHVATLARARGVPMVVSLGDIPAPDGEWALLDGERGEVEIGPTEARLADWRARVAGFAKRRADEERAAEAPAMTRSGRRILTFVNIQGLSDLSAAAAPADGIGLVRTEFLFEPGRAPPDETMQYEGYRAIAEWAGARPVIIRMLDAGGDKPIPGVTFGEEANPFLGVRGLRLLLRRPEVFRTQLRALARAAVHGNLKAMLPMVTTPGELAEAREHLDAAMAGLEGEGLAARRPELGIMVEVPAAALTIGGFDADFYSIGSNDLIQYVTACDRGEGELAALADPLNPAVLELIRRTVEHGKTTGAAVSLCGDMAAEPRCTPALIECGLEALSVAPAALGRLKAAIAGCA
jgi:phosphoenolpyruvate-protein phosphotransferase (PTS system enzyme I)